MYMLNSPDLLIALALYSIPAWDLGTKCTLFNLIWSTKRVRNHTFVTDQKVHIVLPQWIDQFWADKEL